MLPWVQLPVGTRIPTADLNLYGQAFARHSFDFNANGYWQEYQASAGLNLIFGAD